MFFVLTDWHKKNKNDWCAIHPVTHQLIDRDDVLAKLDARIKESKKDVVYCRNWHRSLPFIDYPEDEFQEHRKFLKKHRSRKELKEFDYEISKLK